MEICCVVCGEKISKEIKALNKKMISKKTKEFFCLKCLAEYLCTTEETLKEKIEQFKEEGCTMFL